MSGCASRMARLMDLWHGCRQPLTMHLTFLPCQKGQRLIGYATVMSK